MTDVYSSTKISIPKLIMQTWINKDIPNKWKSSPQSIKKYMLDWNYILMTDDDNMKFVQEHFPEYFNIYNRFPYNIQRADAIRYMWLYIHGGIYIDLDYELQEPIDQLFYSDTGLFLMNSQNFGTFTTNSIMASRKGHPFWLDVLRHMNFLCLNPKIWAVGKHLDVMTSSGPGMLTEVVRDTKYLYTILPQKLICPQSICGELGVSGLLKPLEGSSWASWDTKMMNWSYCNPKLAAFTGIFIFIIFIIIIMLLYFKLKAI